MMLRDSERLVTLTGAGGSGKTRLGLQVGAELLASFPGGVFFVPLAPLSGPELVRPAVERTVGRSGARGAGRARRLVPPRQLRACSRCCRRRGGAACLRTRRQGARNEPDAVAPQGRVRVRSRSTSRGRRGRATCSAGSIGPPRFRAGRLRGRDLPPPRSVCRWPWSSLRRDCVRSTRARCSSDSIIGSRCSQAALETLRPVRRRFAPRSSGATTCFLTSCSESLRGWPSLPAPSRWTPRKLSSTPTSKRSRRLRKPA